MLNQDFGEFMYYLMTTGLVLYLFIFLLAIFGHIFVDFFLKKIVKTNGQKTPVIVQFFLSFGVGTAVYIAISFILLIFNAFNIYTSYIPLIVVDIIYIVYKIRKRFGYSKVSNTTYIDFIKEKRKSILIFLVLMIFFVILQFNLQWPVIAQSDGLIFKDPYSYLREIYNLLQNGSIYLNGNGNGNGNGVGDLYYPDGYFIFCSGALQILKGDYIFVYYFLKVGGIHLLFLFMLIIFYVSLKKFNKVYIAISTVILFLSFYLVIVRFNAFLTGSLGMFFVGISLLIFMDHKRYLYYLGFFIPLSYFFNPTISFYYIVIVSIYLLLYLFYFDRNHNKENVLIILGIIITSVVLLLPYVLYTSNVGVSLFDLINYNFNLFFQPYVTTPIPGPSPAPVPLNVFDSLLQFFFGAGFSLESKAFTTLLIFGFFSLLGLIYRNSKEVNGRKSIHFICKLSFITIIISYLLVMATSGTIFFFVIFQDRIIESLCPFIIILSGFGIEKAEITIQKVGNRIKHDRNFKNNILKKIISPRNIFVLILIPSLFSFRFNQNSLVSDMTIYVHDESLVESYLFLREGTPPNSTILSPDNSLMRKILYDMEFLVSPFNISSTFSEFDTFISANNVNYLLLNKTAYNQFIFNNLTSSVDYTRLYENSIFLIYSHS